MGADSGSPGLDTCRRSASDRASRAAFVGVSALLFVGSAAPENFAAAPIV